MSQTASQKWESRRLGERKGQRGSQEHPTLAARTPGPTPVGRKGPVHIPAPRLAE